MCSKQTCPWGTSPTNCTTPGLDSCSETAIPGTGNGCVSGCRCPNPRLVYNPRLNTCVPRSDCHCFNPNTGTTVVPGSVTTSPHDSCNVCTCSNGQLECTRRNCERDRPGPGITDDGGENVANWCPWSGWTKSWQTQLCTTKRFCKCPAPESGDLGINKCALGQAL